MKQYSEPAIEVLKLDIADVITTSLGPSTGEDDGEWDT